MKYYSLSISGIAFAFGMFNQGIYAALPALISQHQIIKDQIQKEPLMVSHLPESMVKKLSLSAPLSYALAMSSMMLPLNYLMNMEKRLPKTSNYPKAKLHPGFFRTSRSKCK